MTSALDYVGSTYDDHSKARRGTTITLKNKFRGKLETYIYWRT